MSDSLWERLRMRILGKNWKRVISILLILTWRMGDIEFSFLPWTPWMHTLFSKKLNRVFKKFKCAAKLSVSFGFVLTNVEDEIFRCYYPHENNTLMERSKVLATKEDLAEIGNVFITTNVTAECTKERAKTK